MARRKIHPKFFGTKKGEITEHVNAKGGEWPFRMDQWKAIKKCETTKELQVLIGKFKGDIKQVNKTWSDKTVEDRNNKFQRIRDLRTAITMADDYYDILKQIEENGFYLGFKNVPPIVLWEGDKKDVLVPIAPPSKKEKDYVGVTGVEESYIDKRGQQVGFVPWYHKQIQITKQELLDREIENRIKILKTRPNRKKNYWGWKYISKKKK